MFDDVPDVPTVRGYRPPANNTPQEDTSGPAAPARQPPPDWIPGASTDRDTADRVQKPPDWITADTDGNDEARGTPLAGLPRDVIERIRQAVRDKFHCTPSDPSRMDTGDTILDGTKNTLIGMIMLPAGAERHPIGQATEYYRFVGLSLIFGYPEVICGGAGDP
jgi:hypothetical protein